MQTFLVDDDLAAVIWRLAEPKPFENLSFSAALRRVLKVQMPTTFPNEHQGKLSENSMLSSKAEMKKAPSPSAANWVATVADLSGNRGLTKWKAICDFLTIDTGQDSARRKLKIWVAINRPAWPAVPDTD